MGNKVIKHKCDIIRKQVMELLTRDDFPLKAREIADILSTDYRVTSMVLATMVKEGIISHDKITGNTFDYFLPNKKKSQSGIIGYKDLTKIGGVTQRNGAFYYHGSPVTVQQLVQI